LVQGNKAVLRLWMMATLVRGCMRERSAVNPTVSTRWTGDSVEHWSIIVARRLGASSVALLFFPRHKRIVSKKIV
jgi:hypothetical protein